MGYSFLEHTSDVEFRADGVTLEEMFVSAVEALNDVIRGDIEILGQIEKEIVIEGGDNIKLLHGFLTKVLALLCEEDFLVKNVKEISIHDGVLKCVVVGDKAENYKFTNDVKSVTNNEMFVREREGVGFECQIVLEV